MKLTKEQITKIKELRKEGKSTYQIAKQFNVSQSTIFYWTEEDKEKRNLRRRKNYSSKSKEQKNEIYLKKKEYQRMYRKRRYHEDKEFREKIKDNAREYKRQKKNEK